jgi:hypothetical protein
VKTQKIKMDNKKNFHNYCLNYFRAIVNRQEQKRKIYKSFFEKKDESRGLQYWVKKIFHINKHFKIIENISEGIFLFKNEIKNSKKIIKKTNIKNEIKYHKIKVRFDKRMLRNLQIYFYYINIINFCKGLKK